MRKKLLITIIEKREMMTVSPTEGKEQKFGRRRYFVIW
jgi:hypothetical protein